MTIRRRRQQQKQQQQQQRREVVVLTPSLHHVLRILLIFLSAVVGGMQMAAQATSIDGNEEENVALDNGSSNNNDNNMMIHDINVNDTFNKSIVDYLNPTIFNDNKALAEIRQNFELGKLIVIKHAFQEQFAEYVWDALYNGIDDSEWQKYASSGRKSGRNYEKYHYNAMNTTTTTNTTNKSTTTTKDIIKSVTSIFQHTKSREFMTMLSGRDCMGLDGFSLLPSQYKSGSFSNPHSDRRGPWSVTMIWQLSKNWNPEWGGSFYWSNAHDSKNAYQHPSFNTLIMFSITTKSVHLVTPVTEHASKTKSKRLAMAGWYAADLPRINEEMYDIQNDKIEEWYSTKQARSKLTKSQGEAILKMDFNDDDNNNDSDSPRLSPQRKEALLDLQAKITEECFEPSEDDSLYILESS